MRLKKYIYELDDDERLFRSIDVRLVEKQTNYRKIITKVLERYELSPESVQLMDKLNNDLRNKYRGKYIFDFVLDEGKPIEKVRISKKNKIHIKRKMLEFSDYLARTKREFENKLKGGE